MITRKVFDLTLGVTQLLQSKSNDIADGIHMIETLLTCVSETRREVENFHNECYKIILNISKECDIGENVPRHVKRQIHRANHPFSTPSDYFRKSVTIPLLDHLVTELHSRFTENTLVTYKGLYIIPAKIVSLVSKGESWKDKFLPFLKFYEDDLPNPKAIDSELILWERYWVSNTIETPDNVESTLSSLVAPDKITPTMSAISFPSFENIKVVLKILATLPITSCECERSFSSMRRLKNYTRTTMSQNRFNSLALMYLHPEILPDVEDIINRFIGKKKRKGLGYK